MNIGHFYSSKGNLVQQKNSLVPPKTGIFLYPETMPMWVSKQAHISGQLLETCFPAVLRVNTPEFLGKGTQQIKFKRFATEPKMCDMAPKTCDMGPKMCGKVQKMCGMLLKICGMVPKICVMVPKCVAWWQKCAACC